MGTVDPDSAKVRPKWPHEVPFGSWFGLIRHATAGGLAGLTTGFLVGGIGSRIFMRIAGAASGTRGAGRTTEAGFTVGELSAIGTFFLVLFIGLGSGIVGAGMYLVMRPWLGWARKWRGVAFGVMLFALTSATSDIMNPDNRDFSILGNGVLLVALIIALFVVFGVVTDWMFQWFDARLQPEKEGFASVGVAYAIFVGLGAPAVVLIGAGILLGGENICGCEAPVWASWSFVVVCVSTVVIWVNAATRLPSLVNRIAAVTGYLGMGGVLVFGVIRAISDATDIIG